MTAVMPCAAGAFDRGQQWTAEQLDAIERRRGDLLLDASAGSGKTSVLVERFVRAVLEDGAELSAILTITFTDKAAAEMRDRIRARLHELGADAAARATEGAFISTIHAFCARVLRVHALAAGIDPGFAVLDPADAQQLAETAFEEALEEVAAGGAGGVELIASYGVPGLRAAILQTYDELRSRGQMEPQLPPLPAAPDLSSARRTLEQAAARALRELGSLENPSARVAQAIDRLARCGRVIGDDAAGLGELDELALPGGNGAALETPACTDYAEALAGFRAACEAHHARRACEQLDRLLRAFGARFAQRKRNCSGLDFEDLELITRRLLASQAELRESYRSRFVQIMVDELQDTNQVQLELIELLSSGNLFTVGDAQQSIYAFRHADVELFERLGERMQRAGARATLETNFRAREEIIAVLNRSFGSELGDRFRRLRAGRSDPPAADPRVELLVVDKGAEWASEGLAAPWRVAEARALAARVAELLDQGLAAREVVVLTRASTDLRVYERAMEQLGIATYLVGGRGYWSHPQVLDLVAYLRALANPRDEEALYTVLGSPLVGVSIDALVLLAAAARECGRDPFWVMREPQGTLAELPAEDQQRLDRFGPWLASERAELARRGVEELIERGLERTGYDLTVLRMPGGKRRFANVHKLMRIARTYDRSVGGDLRGFLDVIARRRTGFAPSEPPESEAPVEGEALDAVRLMTIHRAKGLEFEVVCVADLGRAPRRHGSLMRFGRDGRFGLRLSQPGTGKQVPALDYRALGDEQLQADAREERRILYVAMTRARERLLVSGAAKLDAWPSEGAGGPIAWVGPALLGDLEPRIAARQGNTDLGVRFAFLGSSEGLERKGHSPESSVQATSPGAAPEPPKAPPPAKPAPPLRALSYSALLEYQRCGYRFYVERVLGVAPESEQLGLPESEAVALGGTERGLLAHALLEQLDFRRPLAPDRATVTAALAQQRIRWAADSRAVQEVCALVEAFSASELRARLARAVHVRREERFAFPLGDVLIVGVFDVIAHGCGAGTLVVDYKTDRLEGLDPAEVVTQRYSIQRIVYALAALRAGAPAVEVVHAFLERPDETVSVAFEADHKPALEAQLERLAGGVRRREFLVSEVPGRGLCQRCPAEGGLCSWPLAMTRREAPDRLF